MSINVKDITFVDISELRLLESLTGEEEIQVSDKNKIKLKTLLDGFITSTYFTIEIAKYYQKTQTYDRVEVDTKMSILSTNLNNALQNYITSVKEVLDTKVTAEPNERLITEEEADKLREAITRATFEEELTDRLSTKVDAEANKRLITVDEADKLAEAVTPQILSAELATKVTAVPNQRLITEQEANRLASAVIYGDLESYSLKDTVELEEVEKVPKKEKQYIKFFDEVNGIEKKINMSNFILGASTVYPTYKTLEGHQDGSNTQFKYRGTLIQESAELYIGGLLYPVNIGFHFEGDSIVITGAPVPKSEDVMRLKAIYLT